MTATGIFKAPNLDIPSTPGQDLSLTRRRFHFLQACGGEFATPSQPYNRGDGIRFHAEDLKHHGLLVESGFSDFVELSDHLCAQILNARTSQTISTKYLGENWLKLEFWVSGKVSLVFRGFGQIDFDGRWCFVHLHREQIAKGEWVNPAEPGISVTLYCEAAYLQETLGAEMERLPPPLRDFAMGQPPTSLFEVLPLTHDIARAVTDLTSVSYTGNLRRLYIEAKAMELFSAVMQALFHRNSRGNDLIRLTRTEERRLTDIRATLLDNLFKPPRVATLARQAAMNQQKLQLGFKQLFGQTIFDFCQDERLEHARRMLETGDYTVTQVALDVGYDFANNFSSAFKRRYGISPKAYQKSL